MTILLEMTENEYKTRAVRSLNAYLADSCSWDFHWRSPNDKSGKSRLQCCLRSGYSNRIHLLKGVYNLHLYVSHITTSEGR